ncbi:MAG TPA: FecR/PupR family sigma factor regulator [Rhizomicrobium sp.]|jgi:transmembrane sensor|nr:FecR/PupR family sigma factor regulator [Rhizomicrobium sp.]
MPDEPPDPAAIEAEAAAWVARFDAGDVSDREQAAFREWLNRSPYHREIFAASEELWSRIVGLLRWHPRAPQNRRNWWITSPAKPRAQRTDS